jgi:hypothetical protein
MAKGPVRRNRPRESKHKPFEKGIIEPLFPGVEPKVFKKPSLGKPLSWKELPTRELLKKANGRAHQLLREVPKIARQLERTQSQKIRKEAGRIAALYNKGKLTRAQAIEFLNYTQWVVDNYILKKKR